MNNRIEVQCAACGRLVSISVEETADEHEVLRCPSCDHAIGTVGQAHALVAQQALGLGATDLRDDHVPVDGQLGEEPGR